MPCSLRCARILPMAQSRSWGRSLWQRVPDFHDYSSLEATARPLLGVGEALSSRFGISRRLQSCRTQMALQIVFTHTHTQKKKVQGLLYMRRERERFVRGTCGLCAFVPVSSGDRVHFLVGMAELTSLNWDFSIQSKIQQADSEPACTETLKRCVFLFLLLWAMARTCPEACRRPS